MTCLSSFKPSINWLLVFIPVSLALERAHAARAGALLLGGAGDRADRRLIVLSTEQLATRTGDAIGGLLNATFGNAPELIIALVALRAGFFDMVRASIIGAILANLMLATGVAFFLGGSAASHAGIQRRRGAALQLDDADLGDQPGRAERVQPLLLAGRHHPRGKAREPRDRIRAARRLRVVSGVPAEDAPGLLQERRGQRGGTRA